MEFNIAKRLYCGIAVLHIEVAALANGFMGAYMKFAGFDAVVIRGTAQKPVHLYLHNGQAELRDASSLS